MKGLLALLLALAVLTPGCYSLRYTSSASSRPISFTGTVEGQRTPFREEQRIWYALWGLVPLSDNDIEKSLIDPHTARGAVQNLSIRTQITALDFLLNVFTGLVSLVSQTATVEGVTVR